MIKKINMTIVLAILSYQIRQYFSSIEYTGGSKVSLHTLGLIPTSCFLLEGCCFSDGILYLLVRGFRRQKFKIRIS